MIDERFVIVGAVLNITGSISYALSTLKGRTKPNRITWFIWAFVPLIAFCAQIQKGVGWQSLMTFMVGFGPLLVFASSLVNKKAYWKITRLDVSCGILSIMALILWAVTKDGEIAIALSILADLLAGLPTLIKSYRDPESENSDVYRNSALSGAITLLTVKTWTFANFGFALYIFVLCVTLYALVKFKLGQRIVV